MTKIEMHQIMNVINNIEDKFNKAAGAAAIIEVKMRLIGELYEPIRVKLKEIVERENIKREKKGWQKIKSSESEYGNCELSILCEAISEVFGHQFGHIRDLRNKLFHVKFASLMQKLGLEPSGLEIFSSGKRNELNNSNIKEAILVLERNRVFEEFKKDADEAKDILDGILLSISE